MKTVLEGVNVQRGHGLVRADDGRQAELGTIAVDAWHIKEHGEEELPKESLGQLHEGDAYIIRWTYSITTLGESRIWHGKIPYSRLVKVGGFHVKTWVKGSVCAAEKKGKYNCG